MMGGERLSPCPVVFRFALLLLIGTVGCRKPAAPKPEIRFTEIPFAGLGGEERLASVRGQAWGATKEHRIVLFAKSGIWWIQPFATKPFTAIRQNTTWENITHVGTEYAALLVKSSYVPPTQLQDLPEVGGDILAREVVRGTGKVIASPKMRLYAPKRLEFSGYTWNVRNTSSDRGGISNTFNPANAWIDGTGHLHLRISKTPNGWECAEVMLPHGLGYGTYSFVVDEITPLEPASVLALYTWDTAAVSQNNREMDVEISPWGYPLNKDVQFVIQPFFVPANLVRFRVPHRALEYSIHWRSGLAEFTARDVGSGQIAAHYSFSSGVPSPGGESVYMGLYNYLKPRYPLQHEAEVLIERFHYFP